MSIRRSIGVAAATAGLILGLMPAAITTATGGVWIPGGG
jgi:hypothetical protein